MKLKKIQFGAAIEGTSQRSFVKSLFFAALLVTLGAVGVSGYVTNDLRAEGDREHLENPAGFELAGTVLPQDKDPRIINGEATPFFGTTWIELLAMLTGAVALLAAAWLCLRHAVETGIKDTLRRLARPTAHASDG